jgi:opacity protein-like surface antigen
VEGRLYYFYLSYRNLIQDALDVKLGRHFVYLPSGSGLIDGATLDFKNIGPVGLKLLGGRDVKFVAERNEVTGGKDRMVAASIYSDAVRLTHLQASYTRRYDDGDTSRELVGASLSTYLPKNVSLYADTKYDILTESTAELLAGVKFAPLEKLTVKGEYYQSFPQFDATSIYSVFAVDKYTEKLIRAEYQITDAYRLALGYAMEDFNNDEDADLYEVGISARPLEDLLLDVSYSVRNGFGGELDGLRLHGAYTMGMNSLSAGADFADYRRDSMAANETARKYWVGAGHKFTQDTSLTARVENNVNVNFDNNYQGVVALNANF